MCNGDLMGFRLADDHVDQVIILQNNTAHKDGAGDFYNVICQCHDQGMRCIFLIRQLVRQGGPDLGLNIAYQGGYDVIGQRFFFVGQVAPSLQAQFTNRFRQG